MVWDTSRSLYIVLDITRRKIRRMPSFLAGLLPSEVRIFQAKLGIVVFNFNPSTWEADLCDLKASLVYTAEFQDNQSYIVRPYLGGGGEKEKQNKKRWPS